MARLVVVFLLAMAETTGPYKGKRKGKNNLFHGFLARFLPDEVGLG